MQNAIHAMY